MKRIMFYTALFVSIAFVACDEEKMIRANDLPANSIAFIETHFPDIEITAVVEETEGFGKDYTVYLANGFDIDFTRSGDWDDVDGHLSAVPESILNLLPKNVPDYVIGVFPGCLITEVNREHYGYEIGLSNGMDLKFNSTGGFIGTDD